jgi:hypothetical protein
MKLQTRESWHHVMGKNVLVSYKSMTQSMFDISTLLKSKTMLDDNIDYIHFCFSIHLILFFEHVRSE